MGERRPREEDPSSRAATTGLGAEPGPRANGSTGWTLGMAIGTTVLLWSSSFVAIRAGLRGYPPVVLAALRCLVAAALFGLYSLRVRLRMPARQDWPRLIASGVLGFALYPVLINLAERRVPAGVASFVVNTGPLFTAILATAFLGEQLPRRAWVGLSISLGGAAILGLNTHSRLAFEPGILLLLVAAIAQAVQFTLQKPLLARYDAISVTSWSVWFGSAALLPWLPAGVTAVAAAPLAATTAALYLGVLPTVVGYGTWAFVTARMPLARAMLWLYLVPLSATMIGWAVLGEVPTAWGALGGLIVVGGVALGKRR